ncbi:MAG: hypothetical protein ACJ8ER_05125 [Allosphingosinicella sp.]
MAKAPPPKAATTPDDFAQVEPDELFPTNNIRFVMWETAKLTERVEGLTKAIDKLGPSFEKALEKHAVAMKERVDELKTDLSARVTDVRNDGTKTHDQLVSVKESVDKFKGAMKLVSALYAGALALVAAFLAWYLKPVPLPPAPATPVIAAPSSQGTAAEINGAASAAVAK